MRKMADFALVESPKIDFTYYLIDGKIMKFPHCAKIDASQSSLEMRRKQFILSVSAFKCRLCSFLALTIEEVEKHLFDEHEDEYLNDAGEMWFEMAKKLKIPLQCEHCENSFMSMVHYAPETLKM